MATYGWGAGASTVSPARGLLGIGLHDGEVATPTVLPTGDLFTQAVCDGETTLFLDSAGAVYYSGSGQYYANGNAAFAYGVDTPEVVRGLESGIVRISIGVGLSGASPCYFALDAAGQLHGWGIQTFGQFGVGGTSIHPVVIVIATDVVDFASGGTHTVILKTGGVVQTAGLNTDGQLGDGTTTEQHTWVTVTPGSGTVVAVAACQNTTALRMADGTVLAVGLGNSVGAANMPNWTAVTFIDSVTDIWGVQFGFLANLSNGESYGMGDNSRGRLGIGNFLASHFAPTKVLLPAGVLPVVWSKGPNSVTTGFADAPGNVYMFGDNLRGQDGTGVVKTGAGGIIYAPQLVPAYIGGAWLGGGSLSLWASSLIPTQRAYRAFAQVIG